MEAGRGIKKYYDKSKMSQVTLTATDAGYSITAKKDVLAAHVTFYYPTI